MSRFQYGATSLGSAILLAALVPVAPGAVLAPYSNDFTTSASDFTLSTAGGGWTLDTSGSGTLNHTNATSGTLSSAALEVTNLGGPVATASNFTITGVYSVSAAAGTSTNVAVSALASNSGFSTGSNQYVLQHFAAVSGSNPSFKLVKGATSSTTLGSDGDSSNELRDLLDVSIQVALAGTYVDTDSDNINDRLDLVATWTRLDTNTMLATISAQDTSPYTGQYFGLRDSNGNNVTMTVAWDSFSLVPEPAGMAGVMLAGAVLLRRSRRAGASGRF
jgi:hypothetical protein